MKRVFELPLPGRRLRLFLRRDPHLHYWFASISVARRRKTKP